MDDKTATDREEDRKDQGGALEDRPDAAWFPDVPVQGPREKSDAYWQISYTRSMRSRSDYVRSDGVEEVQKEIASYKRFKTLMEEWIDLGIEASKLRLKIDKKTGLE